MMIGTRISASLFLFGGGLCVIKAPTFRLETCWLHGRSKRLLCNQRSEMHVAYCNDGLNLYLSVDYKLVVIAARVRGQRPEADRARPRE